MSQCASLEVEAAAQLASVSVKPWLVDLGNDTVIDMESNQGTHTPDPEEIAALQAKFERLLDEFHDSVGRCTGLVSILVPLCFQSAQKWRGCAF